MRMLEGEPWPGNVRSLASVIENAVFRATKGTIDEEVLSQALDRRAPRKAPAREEFSVLSSEERKSEAVVRRALEACDWNGAAAADLLGIPLRTFRRYLSKYNIRKRFG